MKYFFKIFFLILFFSSCSQEKEIYQSNLKYLALGDSYTIGEGIPSEDAYPKQIVKEISLIDSVRIIAKTGWTTDELIDTLDNISLSKYDIVSLLIGVNNQFRGYSIDNYIVEFENLLIRAINFSKAKSNVFVLSIPDYGVTPFGKIRGKEKIYNEINSYNYINRLISEKYNIMYFDITDISREAEYDTTLLADDKLHPSKKMYEIWVEKIKYQLIDSLKSS